jgi:hypothetical protein
MAEWKKIIVSGSDASLNSVTVGLQSLTTSAATTKISGSFTGSFVGDGSGLTGVSAAGSVSSSAQIDITQTTNYTTFSSSIATKNNVQDVSINALNSATSSYALQTQLQGVASSSAQVKTYLPADTVSSSTQVVAFLPAGTVSSSGQVDITATSNYSTFSSSLATVDATQQVSLNALNTATSSYALQSQLAGVASSSSQVKAFLPAGTVSSSGQVSLDSISGTTFSSSNFTFPATLQAVFAAGGIPIACDVDSSTWELSIEELEKARKMHPEIKIVLHTRVFGFIRDLSELVKYCKNNSLTLIIDSAAAFPVREVTENVLTSEVVEVFSLHATKPLAIGEGGLVVGNDENIKKIYEKAVEESLKTYDLLLKSNVAPEIARSILPQGMYTEFIETASLSAYSRLCNLRLDPHAQKEIQEFAKAVYDLMKEKFPFCVHALFPEN